MNLVVVARKLELRWGRPRIVYRVGSEKAFLSRMDVIHFEETCKRYLREEDDKARTSEPF